MIYPLRILLLCGLMLCGTATLADDNAAKLNQLKKEMAELSAMLQQFKSNKSEVEQSLRRSEVDIGELQKQIRALEKSLNSQQQELDALEKKRTELEGASRDQQGMIEQHIVAAYKLGKQSKIKLLLNQEHPEKVSRALTYYDYFNRARSDQMDAYLEVISELNTIEPTITAKATELRSSKHELDSRYKTLLSSKKEREQNLAKINAAIRNKDQNLRQLTTDRERLEKLLDTVEHAITQLNVPGEYRPFASLKGKLPWPIAGKPANRFGARRNDSGLRWQGVSIPAREGSEIKAIHHGRVVFADWFRGSGLLVIIDHGDGYMSLYAHNQSLLSQQGDWVNAGEPIATAGNSGGQDHAGLYFEIRHNGRPSDPANWCRRA